MRLEYEECRQDRKQKNMKNEKLVDSEKKIEIQLEKKKIRQEEIKQERQ